MNVSELLHRYGLRPQKALGQNFLVDESALQRVAQAAQLAPGDLALEVGPGLGSLTRHLAQQARRVIAVELDAALIPPLQETLASFSNVRIIHGDIMQQDISALIEAESDHPPADYRVIANIPYYITSALIRKLLETRQPPRLLVLTVQREVALRICAQPGDLSLLALSVQVYGDAHIVGRIPAGAFYPTPQVDSAILRIELLPQPRLPGDQIETFFRLARAGFSQRRKNLRNALSGGMHWSAQETAALLHSCGIDPTRRAETLHLQEWQELAQTVQASGKGNP